METTVSMIHGGHRYHQLVVNRNSQLPSLHYFADPLIVKAKDFVCNLLVLDPKKRMSAKQALSHEFITKYAGKAPPTTQWTRKSKLYSKLQPCAIRLKHIMSVSKKGDLSTIGTKNDIFYRAIKKLRNCIRFKTSMVDNDAKCSTT